MASYPTKRDWWLLAILWVSFGLMLVGLNAALTEPVAPWMRVFATCFFLAMTALTGGLLVLPYRTSYVLDSTNLTIRLGPFSRVIPLADITEAHPTHNPLSAPAWSLDRVRIRTRTSRFGVLISPERQQQFLAELAERAPHLQWRGEGLHS